MDRVYKSQEWCPVARTLDILGDRWTMLVLRDPLAPGRLAHRLLRDASHSSCGGTSSPTT